MIRRCRTRHCDAWIGLSNVGFCPSCRFIGRIAFYLGCSLAGALVTLYKAGAFARYLS